jgi:hypothetical protein
VVFVFFLNYFGSSIEENNNSNWTIDEPTMIGMKKKRKKKKEWN